MYTVRTIKSELGGRYVNVSIESYHDCTVAIRVALIRAKEAGALVMVQRPNGDVLGQYGLK